ncbi:MAG: nitrilase [Thermoprotei archaeon]|nr:MAG: nitrilase [Thermoprotei archaeon]
MGTINGQLTRDYVYSNSETLEEEFTSSIIDKSQEVGVSLVFTIFLREGDRVYNASLLVEQGVLRAVYRKIHLLDALGYKESSIFTSGDEIVVCDLKGFKVGLAICFDLRFPEIFRLMAYRGANLFIVPSAWYKGPYKIHQWYSLTSCRAHENTAWLIAVDQIGEKFIGHSLIASPMGHIHLDLGVHEKISTAEISIDEVKNTRRTIPVLKLAKRTLYKHYYREL